MSCGTFAMSPMSLSGFTEVATRYVVGTVRNSGFFRCQTSFVVTSNVHFTHLKSLLQPLVYQ